ncbi:MAG: hypothetical protein U5M23_12540 [Marinagarivorans sp.]|nr:hypothetical protein [Marinagarivorans sp.]
MQKQTARLTLKTLVATGCVLAAQQSLAGFYIGGAIGQTDGALRYDESTTSFQPRNLS